MKAVLACVACGEAHNVREARGASHRDLLEIRWEPRGLLGDESKKGTRRSEFQFQRSPWIPVESRLEGNKEGSRVTVRWVQAERMAVGTWEECWRNGGK